jgi:hypothetical protein
MVILHLGRIDHISPPAPPVISGPIPFESPSKAAHHGHIVGHQRCHRIAFYGVSFKDQGITLQPLGASSWGHNRWNALDNPFKMSPGSRQTDKYKGSSLGRFFDHLALKGSQFRFEWQSLVFVLSQRRVVFDSTERSIESKNQCTNYHETCTFGKGFEKEGPCN